MNSNKLISKKQKAAAIEGFNESMYNFDPNQEFDRKLYRRRKRDARDINPEWNAKQRRAYALTDDYSQFPEIVLVQPTVMNTLPVEPIPTTSFGRTPVISVGNIGTEVVPNPKRYVLMSQKSNIVPRVMGFDQFAGMLDDLMYSQNSLTTGSDLANFQAWRAKEYERYASDPANYIWQQIPQGYSVSPEEMARLRNAGLLANRRGTGYYDPTDKSQAYIFGDKTWTQHHQDAGKNPYRQTYWFEYEDGTPVTDPRDLAYAASRITNPEIRNHFGNYMNGTEEVVPVDTAYSTTQDVGDVDQSKFAKMMNGVQTGIVALSAAPLVTEAIGGLATEGSQLVWDGAKWVWNSSGNIWRNAIDAGRSMYSSQTIPHTIQQIRINGRFGPGWVNSAGQTAKKMWELYQHGNNITGHVLPKAIQIIRNIIP